MFVRSITAVAALGMLGAVFASPVLAQNVDPARVLAAKVPAHKGSAKSSHGFADRTARITSIMGSDVSTAAPLHVPTKPVWTRPTRREADASANLR